MEEIESLVKRTADANVSADERLAAFGEIVRLFGDMAYGCAYAILGDFHLAEDAAQEAFLAAYRELGEAGNPNGFPTCLTADRCSRTMFPKHRSSKDPTGIT